jgi:hypothetical protein
MVDSYAFASTHSDFGCSVPDTYYYAFGEIAPSRSHRFCMLVSRSLKPALERCSWNFSGIIIMLMILITQTVIDFIIILHIWVASCGFSGNVFFKHLVLQWLCQEACTKKYIINGRILS